MASATDKMPKRFMRLSAPHSRQRDTFHQFHPHFKRRCLSGRREKRSQKKPSRLLVRASASDGIRRAFGDGSR